MTDTVHYARTMGKVARIELHDAHLCESELDVAIGMARDGILYLFGRNLRAAEVGLEEMNTTIYSKINRSSTLTVVGFFVVL
jgi:hypothetical protein